MSSAATIVRVRARKGTPATRWVNWWRDMIEDGNDGAEAPYPDDDGPWPTYEVAEQKALDEQASDYRIFGRFMVEWLGAFPEGESP